MLMTRHSERLNRRTHSLNKQNCRQRHILYRSLITSRPLTLYAQVNPTRQESTVVHGLLPKALQHPEEVERESAFRVRAPSMIPALLAQACTGSRRSHRNALHGLPRVAKGIMIARCREQTDFPRRMMPKSQRAHARTISQPHAGYPHYAK